jgi:hypothetical protein
MIFKPTAGEKAVGVDGRLIFTGNVSDRTTISL